MGAADTGPGEGNGNVTSELGVFQQSFLMGDAGIVTLTVPPVLGVAFSYSRVPRGDSGCVTIKCCFSQCRGGDSFRSPASRQSHESGFNVLSVSFVKPIATEVIRGQRRPAPRIGSIRSAELPIRGPATAAVRLRQNWE